MGGFNKTCALTNLPLMGGEQVYVFLLEPSIDSNHCYTSCLFSPLLAPFEAEYDSHGRGTESHGPWFPIILEALGSKVLEEEGPNFTVKPENFWEEMFYSAVKDGCLFIGKNHNGDNAFIDFAMVNKEIADRMLLEYSICWYDGDNKLAQLSLDDVVDQIPVFIDLLSKNEADLYSKYALADLVNGYGRLGKRRFSSVINPVDFLYKALQSGEVDFDGASQLLTEYLKGIFIDRLMGGLRKPWIPGITGGQEYDLAAYTLLARETYRFDPW